MYSITVSRGKYRFVEATLYKISHGHPSQVLMHSIRARKRLAKISESKIPGNPWRLRDEKLAKTSLLGKVQELDE